MIIFDIDRRKYVNVTYHWEIISGKKYKIYFDRNDRNYKYGKGYHTNVVFLTPTQILELLNERCKLKES